MRTGAGHRGGPSYLHLRLIHQLAEVDRGHVLHEWLDEPKRRWGAAQSSHAARCQTLRCARRLSSFHLLAFWNVCVMYIRPPGLSNPCATLRAAAGSGISENDPLKYTASKASAPHESFKSVGSAYTNALVHLIQQDIPQRSSG
eukprot:COSAG01_NODE_119_length_25410_cov_1333.312275_24_plen_144_part_00